MRYCAIATTAILLSLTACTIQGLRATQVAASATCAAGAAIDAAGEPVGGIIEVAACWLADYTAQRIARLESVQPEAASVEETARVERRDAAADELAAALDMCDPDGATADQETAVARALAKCKSLAD